MLDVGVIGTGAIGSHVVRHLTDGAVPDARIRCVHNRTIERAHTLVDSLDVEHRIHVVEDPIAVCEHVDVVVEAAGQPVVQELAVAILETGTDLIVMSVGAFRDPDLLTAVRVAADEHDSRLHVPSGAIAGLDGIGALGNGSLESVSFDCYRAPAYLGAYVDDDVDTASLKEGELIFEGSAREAAGAFPSHMNVAIALTLAAKVEPEDVAVRIFVEYDAPRSRYVISAPADAGSIEIEIQNYRTPSDPDTSLLNVFSIVEKLRRTSDRVTIGT